MILNELTIYNFGLFKGEHTLVFGGPSRTKPITLIGGLNGSGKTTILDALQLVLFGNRARVSNRGDLAYEEYLRRSIHRKSLPAEAFVRLHMTRTVEGQPQRLRITRKWGGDIKKGDSLAVERDGVLDRHLSERWLDFIEQFVPVEISRLFFFDGEKIERFADPSTSQELIASAIGSLLGLDLVSKLEADLTVLERRKQIDTKSAGEQKEIHQYEQKLDQLRKRREEITQERAGLKNELDRCEKRCRDIELLYKKRGGQAYDRRQEIEARAGELRRALTESRAECLNMAEGPAPFLLVQGLLAEIDRQHRREVDVERSRILAEGIAERDSDLLKVIEKIGLSDDQKEKIERFLDSDRNRRGSWAKYSRYLHLSEETAHEVRELLTTGLKTLRVKAIEVLDQHAEIRERLLDEERNLATIPTEDALSELLKLRSDEAESQRVASSTLQECDSRLAHLANDIDAAKDRIAALYSTSLESQFAVEDDVRVAQYSASVRQTLKNFRHAVAKEHADRIQRLILDSFLRIIRKGRLVSNLSIDPESLTVSLYDGSGNLLTTDRLSAGERQLLAVALLWGLAKASGYPLPVVIDTPLGRLDSRHRASLIKNYFPNASHQVIILSTNQEIDANLYDKLDSFISTSYEIIFDEATGSSDIHNGYFVSERRMVPEQAASRGS